MLNLWGIRYVVVVVVVVVAAVLVVLVVLVFMWGEVCWECISGITKWTRISCRISDCYLTKV